MTDKDREAFEAIMVGRKLLVRSIPEPSHKMLLDEHYITYQAARDESAKEIAWLKDVICTSVRNERLAHEQIERLQRVVDAAKKVNDMRHADNATGNSFVPDRTDRAIDVLEKALAATQNTKEGE